MSLKKAIYLLPLIFLAVLVFEYFQTTKVEVDDAVRPYLEKCLDLIIEKDHKIIYDTYVHERTVSLEEFSARMNYFANIFGAEPESFSYMRSYVGGVGYFIQYNLVLSGGNIHSCTFGFPAKEKGLIGVNDLRSMSVSADMGEKGFTVNFLTGNVLACKAPDGCYGEN